MNTLELSLAIEADEHMSKYCLGAMASNQLPRKIRQLPVGMILNLQPLSQKGSHWIAVFIDAEGFGEYFCSYGSKPAEKFTSFLRNHCYDWTHNQKRVQGLLSSTCGQHCIFYLMLRCRGLTMPEIFARYSSDCDYNDEMVVAIINKKFSLSTSVYDTDFIEKQINKL